MTTSPVPDRPALLLAVGDIHLGRRPSRLPDALADHGLSPRDLGPARALADACRFAIERGVDAVLLAGDVVDEDEAFLEAYPSLREAARTLASAGIAMIAVAGNHDTRVLPRLVRDVTSARLLGARGTWETALVERDGVPIARVVGWSFPDARVTASPLATYPAAWRERRFGDAAPDALPTLGLLHCELDASGGYHAPVRRAEIDATGIAFALGHVHKPGELAGTARPVGYLGSLSALDPGESGARGPWLFESTADGWRAEQVPLAPLAYEAVAVDAGGAADPHEIERRSALALERLVAALDARGARARAVAARVSWIGERQSTVSRPALAPVAAALGEPRAIDGRVVFVESAEDATRAPLVLAALAEVDDPPGLLARRLLALERDGEERTALLARARAALAPRIRALGRDDGGLGDDEQLAARLAREGRIALEELLAARNAP